MSWLNKIKKEKGIKSKDNNEEPKLYKDLDWVWVAFMRISKRRNWDDGIPTAITVSDIYYYSKLFYIKNSDILTEFFDYISVMDEVFCKFYIDQRTEQLKRDAAKNKQR